MNSCGVISFYSLHLDGCEYNLGEQWNGKSHHRHHSLSIRTCGASYMKAALTSSIHAPVGGAGHRCQREGFNPPCGRQ